MDIALLAPLFFIVAIIYASAGLGGGSGYVALLLLFVEPIASIRYTALMCNVVVVGGSTFNFHRAGLLELKKIWPIVLLSVPLAFIGGLLMPEAASYKTIAAIVLVFIAVLMLLTGRSHAVAERSIPKGALTMLGGGIGFISGIIGIGGGILLSPVLHLIHWAEARKIGACTSYFILVNSLAALAGLFLQGAPEGLEHTLVLVLAVFLGGQIGNRLNIRFIDPKWIRYLTALLVGSVGLKLLIEHCL